MLRLLIAEDELIERMVLKKTLEKHFGSFVEILEAENGNQAMEVFLKMDIDIVILDIEMPGMNGVQAAELMRREKSGFCLIFLTAYDKFEYAKKAIAVRAMEYLLKPYSERELVSLIEEAIRLTEKYKNNREQEPDEGTMAQELSLMGASNPAAGSEAGLVLEEMSLSRLNVLVSMIEEYIRKSYMNDISMQDAARAVNYSETYFSKMFKQQFGMNFTAYLTEYRMEEAKKLLKQPNVSVREIGARVGYADSNYFARVFKRHYKISPSEFRMNFLREL